MFKNAQGKFDGRIFMGLCMGLGTAAGLVIKVWMSFDGGISAFWLWAVPGVCVLVGVSVWLTGRRHHTEIRERLERSARVRPVRRTDEHETEAAEAEGTPPTGMD